MTAARLETSLELVELTRFDVTHDENSIVLPEKLRVTLRAEE